MRFSYWCSRTLPDGPGVGPDPPEASSLRSGPVIRCQLLVGIGPVAGDRDVGGAVDELLGEAAGVEPADVGVRLVDAVDVLQQQVREHPPVPTGL